MIYSPHASHFFDVENPFSSTLDYKNIEYGGKGLRSVDRYGEGRKYKMKTQVDFQ